MKYQRLFVAAAVLFIILQICLIKGVIFYYAIYFKIVSFICIASTLFIIIKNKWWAGIFYWVVVLCINFYIILKTVKYNYKSTFLELGNQTYVTVNSKFFDVLPEGNDVIRIIKAKHIVFEEELLVKSGNIKNFEKMEGKNNYKIFLSVRNFFNDRNIMDTIYINSQDFTEK